MNKKKLKFSSNENNVFKSSYISRRFKRHKRKSASFFDVFNDENDKSSLLLKKFQSSAKNVDFRQNDFINAESNFNEFVKNQNEIKNVIDKYVQNTQLDENYDSINENKKSIKINVSNFDKL